MTTLSRTYSGSYSSEHAATITSAYNRFIKKLEFNHFSLIAMAILIGSCLGSIATMQVFENNAPLWQFIVSLAFTMANLVACIGQVSTKWVVNFFAASLIVNTILVIANIL